MASFGEANLIGRTFGKCELRQILGSGGMGVVYRAHQTSPEREVAVKVLRVLEPGTAARFAREAQILADLEHPHVVPIYDYGVQDATSYIIMRLMLGGSLAERVKQQRFTFNETIHLVDELADALDYVHSQGVIHRDLKPSNVLYDRHGKAYLADFGVARLYSRAEHLTITGRQPGTPSYMAPELWREEEPVEATDLYALGILTFLVLTGELPFTATTWLECAGLHLTRRPPPPHSIDPAVPSAVDEVLIQALAKEPGDRFQSAGAFAGALRLALGTSMTTTQPVKEYSGESVNKTAPGGARKTLPAHHPHVHADDSPAHSPPIPHARRPVPHGWWRPILLILCLYVLMKSAVPETEPPEPTLWSTISPEPTAGSSAAHIPVVTVSTAGTATDVAPLAPPVPAITRHPGNLTEAQSRVRVPMSWTAGEIVDVWVHSMFIDSTLALIQAGGQKLADSDDCRSGLDPCLVEYVVPATGQYELEIGSYQDEGIGVFTLEVTQYSACGEPPVAVVNTQLANIREAPSEASEILGTSAQDSCYSVVGRTSNETWWKVARPDSEFGWMAASVVRIVGDTVAVPVTS